MKEASVASELNEVSERHRVSLKSNVVRFSTDKEVPETLDSPRLDEDVSSCAITDSEEPREEEEVIQMISCEHFSNL